MSFTEKVLKNYDTERRAERNRALRQRLAVPRTTEELFEAMRTLDLAPAGEWENRAKYAKNV